MVVPKFTVKPQPNDPYRNFTFRIKIDNNYVAGLSKCDVLSKTMEMVDRRGGGDLSTIHKLPGKTKSEAITLTTGITRDKSFEEWANLVNNFKGDAAISLKMLRKDIIIDVFNEANQKGLSYYVYNCWVSEYQAVPDLDAGVNAVLIQTIKLENEGWKREPSVIIPIQKKKI